MTTISQHHTYIPLSYRIFIILTSIFIALLILSNIISGKYFTFSGIPLSCGTLVYPFTFVITNIVLEIYGLYRAKLLVFTGFIVILVITALVWIANKLPIDQKSPIDASSFLQIFRLSPGIWLGYMLGYLSAQFKNIQLFEYLRKVTNNKYLWLRHNLATFTSQLVYSFIVVTISFIIWPMIYSNTYTQPISYQVWSKIIAGQCVFQCMLALLHTPFVYASTYLIKKWLGLQR